MNSNKLVSKITFMLAIVGLSTMSMPAFAAHVNACADDIQKFCSSVDPKDHKAIGACLKEHKTDVSADCQKQMAHHHKKTSGSTTAPGAPAAAPAAGAAQ